GWDSAWIDFSKGLGAPIGGVIAGKITDRFGIVPAMAISIAFLGVANVLAGLSGALWQFVAAYFLIGLGLFGAILLLTRFARLGRRLMVTALILLAVCAFSPLSNFVLYPLEQRFPKWDDSRGDPDGIIVLGGSLDPDLAAAHGVPVISSAGDRITGAAALSHRYPNARL
ncbi:hypothetical protein KXW38_001842, partial [Aspergillus fumigatus]